MIRTLLAVSIKRALAAALVVFSLPAAAADKGQLDADPALFTVMAALDAAGYGTEANSPANHPLRKAVREHLQKVNAPSLKELKLFFAEHKLPDPGANLAQYVSFALSVEGPPDFKFRYPLNELSPDVSPLQSLNELLAAFYKEANIEDVWEKSQPTIEQVLSAYQDPVTRGVQQANAYLRNPTSGFLGRRFQIYIDLLAAPNQVHTRSFKDDYFIVVTSAPELQTEEIRHAYLHYLLDPMVLKFSEAMARARGLADFTEAAPALPEAYKTDYLLLSTECLIKAVESRLLPTAKRQAVVDQALAEGFVMTPAFADGLAGYEKQPEALRLYFPELVKLIDLRKEEQRLSSVKFVRYRAVKTTKAAPPPEPVVELTPAQKAAEAADALYKDRKLDAARQGYLRLLETGADRTVHARAYYGLARVAVLQNQPEEAEKLFRRTLELAPEPDVRGWSLVYLGRLYDAQGERDQATENYKLALSVEGISAGARQAAEKGLQQSYTKQK
ncbi:MAG: tetratricopeptide repeat protein [Acidobacteria bacterium]|nr:tetratricopeptide repeat protein [Acidobacteriota bacterium]